MYEAMRTAVAKDQVESKWATSIERNSSLRTEIKANNYQNRDLFRVPSKRVVDHSTKAIQAHISSVGRIYRALEFKYYSTSGGYFA